MDFSKLIKEIKTDPANTPWYKKKVSIIAMSSTLGVGVLTTAIAVPVALTSGSASTSTFEVTGIKSVYDLNTKYAKLIISGTNLPNNSSSYKILSSTIKNARGPITSAVTLTQVSGGVQLGFNDSSLIATTTYQIVINDSSPIDIKESFVQPIINIGTQPTSQTIADATTSKIVTLTIAASVQNKIPNYELSYQWQTSNTNDQNNDSTWTDIDNAKNTTYEVDATSFPVTVKKYYRCLVSYEFTEVKKSSSVYVEKAAGTITPPPPPTIDPTQAIATFNNKPVADKINAYNSIMANTTNNTAIKNYFIKQGGMSQFFNENVQPISSGGDKAVYDAFKAFLPTYTGATVSNSNTDYNVEYIPADGTNFLKIKAIGKTVSSNNNVSINTNVDESTNSTNIYCTHGIFNTNFGRYTFYSPILSLVTNVIMNSDFSITMTLSTGSNIQNMAFKLIDSSFISRYTPYKATIKFSDLTLFPGMSQFVKTNILNLTA